MPTESEPRTAEGDPPAKTVETRPIIKPLNRGAALLGLVILAGSIGVFATPQLIGSMVAPLPNLLVCIGLALILFAVGDEARLSDYKSITLVGAAAIGFMLFYLLENATAKRDVKVGLLSIEHPDQGASKTTSRRSAEDARIYYKGGAWVGVRQDAGANHISFLFHLAGADRANLKETECPEVFVNFKDGPLSFRFKQNNINISSPGYVFDLMFRSDTGKVSYYGNRSAVPLELCNQLDLAADIIKKQNTALETNTDVQPSAAAAPENTPLVGPVRTASPGSSSAAPRRAPLSVPSEPSLVGYVIYGELNPRPNRNPKSWFDIEGKPEARFPAPNDVLRVRRPVYIRPVPYRWDVAQRKHVEGAKEIDTLRPDQKIIVGGDSIISYDENKQLYYIVVPISVVEGKQMPSIEPFKAIAGASAVSGYVYAGSLDDATGDLSDRIFDNITRPDAVYPVPNDILLARSNVWLRTGPRRWDRVGQQYVNEGTVKPIKQGQYVRVSGDTSLAKGGLSIWVPIDRITSGIEEARAD